MKWVLALVALGAIAAGSILLVPKLSADLEADIGVSESLRTSAITAAEGITERALEAAAELELTAELAADINERFAQACEYQAVLRANLDVKFQFTEGIAEQGKWTVEPRCDAAPR